MRIVVLPGDGIANVLKIGDGMFLDFGREVARGVPGPRHR